MANTARRTGGRMASGHAADGGAKGGGMILAQRAAGRARSQNVDLHVGARVRDRRILLGMTQHQLADLIGVTYQQAHKYEKGINRVAAGRLYYIAQALGGKRCAAATCPRAA